MSAPSASPNAVAKALRLRTAAAITFVKWAIAALHKAAQERPDLAETIDYKNADHDLASLKRRLEQEGF
ncbi:MAG: hypothetical protein ABSE62_00400 [Chthoniobacteraceae bacterium]|jgi:hypothetical protein